MTRVGVVAVDVGFFVGGVPGGGLVDIVEDVDSKRVAGGGVDAFDEAVNDGGDDLLVGVRGVSWLCGGEEADADGMVCGLGVVVNFEGDAKCAGEVLLKDGKVFPFHGAVEVRPWGDDDVADIVAVVALAYGGAEGDAAGV